MARSTASEVNKGDKIGPKYLALSISETKSSIRVKRDLSSDLDRLLAQILRFRSAL